MSQLDLGVLKRNELIDTNIIFRYLQSTPEQRTAGVNSQNQPLQLLETNDSLSEDTVIIAGSKDDDFLTGSNKKKSIIYGYEGNDRLFAGNRESILHGGLGDRDHASL